jgi:hypothetical protein
MLLSYSGFSEGTSTKTINLEFTRKRISNPKATFACNGPENMAAEIYTHLGLKFQSDGSWKSHILNIREKTSGRLKHFAYAEIYSRLSIIDTNMFFLYTSSF